MIENKCCGNCATDNEIKKALECCWHNTKCVGNECPFFELFGDCAPLIAMETLDLINRQEAEIERLNNCVKSEDEVREIAKRTMEPLVREITREQIDTAVKLAKAEARKEFAERAKEKSWDVPYETKNAHFVQVVDVGDIDNLLKELNGG